MFLFLMSCYPVETGVDSTTLSGRVTVPADPEVFEESNDPSGLQSRDRIDRADAVGDLGWRYKQVTGTMREWPAVEGDPTDEDFFTFAPIAGGEFTITVTLASAGGPPAPDTGIDDTADTADTGSDTGETGDPGPAYEENQVSRLRLFDPTVELEDGELPTPLAEALTSGGVATLTFAAEAGKDYAFSVEGLQNLEGDGDEYTVWLSGSAPADANIKVGAYGDASEMMNRTGLSSGSDIQDWVLEGTTWVGTYTMTWFKTVESGSTENSYGETIDTHTVVEGQGTVYLVGGTFKSLNDGLPAGTLHNANPVQVDLRPNKANEADDVVLDTIAPKVIGWVVEEVEPNDATEGGGPVDIESGDIQDLPVPSGLGFVDVLTGTASWTGDVASGAYADESSPDYDVFRFVPEADMDCSIVMTVDTAGVNLDAYIANSAGEYVAAGWAVADTNPEFFTMGVFDEQFVAGETYYLVVEPWEGAAGEHAYTIELEWVGL